MSLFSVSPHRPERERQQVWHVYWNGSHILGPVTYLVALAKHEAGPNDSCIVDDGSTVAGVESQRELVTDQNVEDMMDTAAYGAISYWAKSANQWQRDATPHGYDYVIVDREDGFVFYRSKDDIRAAYLQLVSLDQKFVNRTIHGYFIDSYRHRNEDGVDTGFIDADAADALVQVACFSEVVYG